MLDITKEEDVTINGYKCKKVFSSAFGEVSASYFIPIKNYIIQLDYSYGKDDKDKEMINNIIHNSFFIGDSLNIFTETHQYTHTEPLFYIQTNDEWPILVVNSKLSPIQIFNKSIKDTYITITIEKIDEDIKNLTNEEYLKTQEQLIETVNQMSSILGIEFKITNTDAHYKINNEITDGLRLDANISKSNGEIIQKAVAYGFRTNEYEIGFALSIFNNNQDNYTKVLNDFNNMLKSFTLSDGKNIKDNSSEQTSNSDDKNTEDSSAESNPSSNSIKIKDKTMYGRLKGKIILTVEKKGEAYWISPKTEEMHYLGKPADAFNVMREQGIGITNADLEKIPLGLDNLSGQDTDGDGLSDLFEDAIGTEKNNKDSDGDGFEDFVEIKNGYNPKGAGKLNPDKNFTEKHSGKIFLQVENKGEAWYINPKNGKRYFLGRPSDAFNVMRNLGLGISNENFEKM